jgi:hypothetical protein
VEPLPELPLGTGWKNGKREKPVWPEVMGGRLHIRFAGFFATVDGASFERVKVYADSGNTSQQAAIA